MYPDLIASRRAPLAEAIPFRFSSHSFSASPSLQDWSVLSYLAGRWQRDGICLRPARVPDGFFSGGILRFDRITGTDTVCILSGPQTPQHTIAAGFLAEAFVLECTALSLATCWLTGSILRKPLPIRIPNGETVFALIAVGHPAEKQPPRNRKDLSRLCDGNYAAWLPCFQKAAQYVREAPSASNAQPFLMQADDTVFSIDSSDRTRLDLGAAVCHASLALDMPHRWEFSAVRSRPMASCICAM